MIHRRREMALDIYNLILGGALFAAPWLFAYAHKISGVDDLATSVLIVASSTAALLAFAEWEEWTSLILGLWVLASPWLLGFQHGKAIAVNVAIGLLITYISALELWLIHYDPAPPPGRDRPGPAAT